MIEDEGISPIFKALKIKTFCHIYNLKTNYSKIQWTMVNII